MSANELTGRTRYRVGFRGRIIVQVESWWGGIPAGCRNPYIFGEWHDASPLDLQQLESPKIRNPVDKPEISS